MGKRKFFIGDDWLYYKIYANPGIQQRLLIREIFNLIQNLYKSGLIEKFFFVRYYDNDGSHLRLRFFIIDVASNLSLIILSINSLFKKELESRRIIRILTDTYVRELERYDPIIINEVETLFSYNSNTVLLLLKTLENRNETDKDWLYSISYIDSILNMLGFSFYDKHILYDNLFLGFAKDINIDSLKQKFRNTRFEIAHALNSKIFEKSFKKKHSNNLMPEELLLLRISQNIRQKSETRFKKLIQDFIHMHFNRLFSNDQNLLESIVYYLMSSYFKSLHIQAYKKLEKKYE